MTTYLEDLAEHCATLALGGASEEHYHEHLLEAYRRGFERGLVVGVAIVNWAEAIRKNAPRKEQI